MGTLQAMVPQETNSHVWAYVPFCGLVKGWTEKGGDIKERVRMITAEGLARSLGVDKLKTLIGKACSEIGRVPFAYRQVKPHLGSAVKVRV